MNDLEQTSEPLPVDENTILKIFHGTSQSPLYQSTQDFVNLMTTEPISCNDELYQQGTKVEILEPGKQWKTGKIRLRLVFEFISDKQENNKSPLEVLALLKNSDSA